MRLILAGIAALVMGFAFGLAFQSGGHEAGSAKAEPPSEPSRMSVFGTIHPKRFDAAWDSLALQVPEGPRLQGPRLDLASLGTDIAVEQTDRRSEPSRRPRLS